jgi:hypothetical protein
LIGGVTEGEVVEAVAVPSGRSLTTLNAVAVVLVPVRMRQVTTVPLTGETSPPGAAAPADSEAGTNVHRYGPQFWVASGALPRLLPRVTVP